MAAARVENRIHRGAEILGDAPSLKRGQLSVRCIRQACKGKKPLMVGEFGFFRLSSTEALLKGVVKMAIEEQGPGVMQGYRNVVDAGVGVVNVNVYASIHFAWCEWMT